MCASADWGIKEGHAFERGARSEAAGVKKDAAREKEGVIESEDAAVSRRRKRVAPILAKAVLRFQRV